MATSNYPGSLDDYSTLPSSGTPITVSSHYFGPAITNIEAELGTDPAGSFTDVKSRLNSGLVTQADIWRLTASKTADNTVINANLQRANDASSGLLGAGVTESGGIFTFPETGIYQVIVQAYFGVATPPDNCLVITEATINNSSYDEVAYAAGSQTYNAGDSSGYSQCLIDVTDTANVKVRFVCSSFGTNNFLYGVPAVNATCFSFIRVGGT